MLAQQGQHGKGSQLNLHFAFTLAGRVRQKDNPNQLFLFPHPLAKSPIRHIFLAIEPLELKPKTRRNIKAAQLFLLISSIPQYCGIQKYVNERTDELARKEIVEPGWGLQAIFFEVRKKIAVQECERLLETMRKQAHNYTWHGVYKKQAEEMLFKAIALQNELPKIQSLKTNKPKIGFYKKVALLAAAYQLLAYKLEVMKGYGFAKAAFLEQINAGSAQPAAYGWPSGTENILALQLAEKELRQRGFAGIAGSGFQSEMLKIPFYTREYF